MSTVALGGKITVARWSRTDSSSSATTSTAARSASSASRCCSRTRWKRRRLTVFLPYPPAALARFDRSATWQSRVARRQHSVRLLARVQDSVSARPQRVARLTRRGCQLLARRLRGVQPRLLLPPVRCSVGSLIDNCNLIGLSMSYRIICMHGGITERLTKSKVMKVRHCTTVIHKTTVKLR